MPLLPQTLEEHGSFVRSLARSLLADSQGADDLAQDAWVVAMERPPRHAGNLRGWFGTVVHRLARQARRSAELRSLREAASARPEAQADVSEGLVRREVLRSVLEAVLSLEEPYQETVLLRFYEGLDPKEIAARARVPIATVRSRLQRALEHLRTRLDREWGGDRETWCRGLVPFLGAGKFASVGAGGGLAIGWGGTLVMGAATKITSALIATGFVALVVWRGGEAIDPIHSISTAQPAGLPGVERAPEDARTKDSLLPGALDGERIALTLDGAEESSPEGEAVTRTGSRLDYLPYPNGGEAEFAAKYATYDLEHLMVAFRILNRKLDRDLRAIADIKFESGIYESDHGDDSVTADLRFTLEPKPGIGRAWPVSRARNDFGQWVTEWTFVTEDEHPEIFAKSAELLHVQRRAAKLAKALE